jgi:hypothetical protein
MLLVQKLKMCKVRSLATIVIFDLAYYNKREVKLKVEYRIEMGKETPHQSRRTRSPYWLFRRYRHEEFTLRINILRCPKAGGGETSTGTTSDTRSDWLVVSPNC